MRDWDFEKYAGEKVFSLLRSPQDASVGDLGEHNEAATTAPSQGPGSGVNPRNHRVNNGGLRQYGWKSWTKCAPMGP